MHCARTVCNSEILWASQDLILKMVIFNYLFNSLVYILAHVGLIGWTMPIINHLNNLNNQTDLMCWQANSQHWEYVHSCVSLLITCHIHLEFVFTEPQAATTGNHTMQDLCTPRVVEQPREQHRSQDLILKMSPGSEGGKPERWYSNYKCWYPTCQDYITEHLLSV